MGVATTASNPSHRNAAGSSASELAAECREVEAGAAAQRRDPVGDHQHDADDQQADGDVGHRDQQPADAVLGRRGPVVGWRVVDRGVRVAGHVNTRSSSWTAV